jgi:hypothetical protein
MIQKGGPDAEAKTRYWQLPFIPPVQKPEQSEEELARKAAIKEKQGQRLRDMANAKRESKIADLEANVQGLEYLLQVCYRRKRFKLFSYNDIGDLMFSCRSFLLVLTCSQ